MIKRYYESDYAKAAFEGILKRRVCDDVDIHLIHVSFCKIMFFTG
jgi:hypothetical protein